MSHKILISFIILVMSIQLSAQTTFIYVDVSGNVDRDLLKTELETKLSISNDLIYFISNDISPKIGTNLNSLNEHLNELSSIIPSIPISYKEVDTLLSILDDKRPPITLMFYLDYQYAKSGGIQNLIDRLLLSNGWLNKAGLNKAVLVKINLQRRENLNEKQINELSKNGIYEIIIY